MIFSFSENDDPYKKTIVYFKQNDNLGKLILYTVQFNKRNSSYVES